MHDLDMKQERNLTLKVWEILSKLDIHTWEPILSSSRVHSNRWYKQVIPPLRRRGVSLNNESQPSDAFEMYREQADIPG